jgi:membrane associated rhomboid family serine protease
MSMHLRRSLAVSLGGARATWWLAAALLGIWLAVAAVGGPPACLAIYQDFGLTRAGIAAGKPWQLLSHAMLHGSSFHLLLNLVWLVLVGGKLEHILGSRALLAIFGAGVLGGAAGHLLLAPGGPGAPILVGASGGAMALLLALTTLSPESRMWPLPVSGKNLGLGLLAASLLLALLHPALGCPGLRHLGHWLATRGAGDLFQFGHACHFGGGIAGWLAGRWILRPRVSLERLQRARARQESRAAKGTGRAV